MLEVITGLSLAAAAGLNAYVPLLGIGLLAKFTGLIALPTGWAWLENSWTLGILGVLLLIELIVDKVPALDTVNDILQTVVRPASGGIVFSAGSASTTVAVSDPEAFIHSETFWPFVLGVVIALVPHLLKLLSRPVVNLATAGAGAAVMSTVEDIASVVVTVLAVVLPILALILIIAFIVFISRWIAKRRKHRAAKLAAA